MKVRFCSTPPPGIPGSTPEPRWKKPSTNEDASAVLDASSFSFLQILLGSLGNDLFQVLTDLEFHHRASRNGDVLARIPGVTSDLGLYFFSVESAKVAEYNGITISQSFGNRINRLPDDFKHFDLRAAVIQLSTSLPQDT